MSEPPKIKFRDRRIKIDELELWRHASLPKVIKDLIGNDPWRQFDPRSIWPAL
jgi:hypothetical protein